MLNCKYRIHKPKFRKVGNGVAKVFTCMTHRHGLTGGGGVPCENGLGGIPGGGEQKGKIGIKLIP